MKHKLGTALVFLGCGLIVVALALFLKNQQEQRRAAAASEEAIVKVVEVIQEHRESNPTAEPVLPPAPDAAAEQTMTEVDIDSYSYVGFLALPSLELELPVMADWSYPQLKLSPCRYSGSTLSDDLVIMAHNYPKHFGKLRDMRAGDTVTFTDMDGVMVEYQVMALDILAATAVEDMTSGDYDLTLFTCTYGGESRVAVRCDRLQD